MAPRTIKKALKDMLAKLSKAKFESFCDELVDRREEPLVFRSSVEDKSRLEIADLLVSTFTEAKAVEVAVELLEEINCSEEAKQLVADTSGLLPASGFSSTAGPSAGAAAATPKAEEEHFVDKHRKQLVDRVSNIAAILDDLLEAKVLSQGVYAQIMVKPTTEDKMRELYMGPLKAGRACKDIFLKVLEDNEKYLIDELKAKK